MINTKLKIGLSLLVIAVIVFIGWLIINLNIQGFPEQNQIQNRSKETSTNNVIKKELTSKNILKISNADYGFKVSLNVVDYKIDYSGIGINKIGPTPIVTNLKFIQDEKVIEISDPNNDGNFGMKRDYNNIWEVNINVGGESCYPPHQTIKLTYMSKEKINFTISNLYINSIQTKTDIETEPVIGCMYAAQGLNGECPAGGCVQCDDCPYYWQSTKYPDKTIDATSTKGVGPDIYYYQIEIFPFNYDPSKKEFQMIEDITFDIIKME